MTCLHGRWCLLRWRSALRERGSIIAGRNSGVPKIVIRCPAMGKPIDTGLHTEAVVFRSLEGFTFEVKCPKCGSIHKWTTANAWIEREWQ